MLGENLMSYILREVYFERSSVYFYYIVRQTKHVFIEQSYIFILCRPVCMYCATSVIIQYILVAV